LFACIEREESMKATEANFLAFLQKSTQFIIPLYQRTYSWTEKQCRQLWEDVLRAGASEDIAVHFIGSIVYVEQDLSQVSHQSPLLVIDGQQRLTTLSLLIEAIARAVGDTEPIQGFTSAKLRAYFLTNPLESGERFFKLLLSQTDAGSLKAIVRGTEQPRDLSLRVIENFDLFSGLLASSSCDLATVCRGLAKLVVVDIALKSGQDNPQLIFESMNSTGKELSQADLIRNFVLMGLEPALQSRLYEECWRPMELEFGQEAYGTQFDGFMRHYLTVRSGEIPRERDVYEAFKAYARTKPVAESGVEALVHDIRGCANRFCAIALGKEENVDLAAAFHDLRELKVDVAYPLLLTLYEDYAARMLSVSDFCAAVRLIESYVFRRAICSIPTNSMNKTFGTFSKAICTDAYLDSIKAHFLLMPSYRRFPRDEEFQRALLTRDLYNFPRRSYWLRRLENHGRKERVVVDDYTIEHILPQNPHLSHEWQTALGPDWQRIQEHWLHTLGNLTLTAYNSEYSDRPFREKRDMKGGFAESPLRLNASLKAVEEWNEDAIKDRARSLSKVAVDVWAGPLLPEERLSAFTPSASAIKANYTIDDHPLLSSATIGPLYEALRGQVLSLDPCITEEYRKFYVTFKAETTVLDVYPQRQRLRLILNIPFLDLSDPRSACKDMTGAKLNGDVEFGVRSADDLRYAVGLVRQAYERQMEADPIA
jgi:uncharacterized protein with ParB-like and HNH nuclease domain/predicted transport protein